MIVQTTIIRLILCQWRIATPHKPLTPFAVGLCTWTCIRRSALRTRNWDEISCRAIMTLWTSVICLARRSHRAVVSRGDAGACWSRNCSGGTVLTHGAWLADVDVTILWWNWLECAGWTCRAVSVGTIIARVAYLCTWSFMTIEEILRTEELCDIAQWLTGRLCMTVFFIIFFFLFRIFTLGRFIGSV